MMAIHLPNTGLIRLTPTRFRRIGFILSGKINRVPFGLAVRTDYASSTGLQKNLRDINLCLTLLSTTRIFVRSMKTIVGGCGLETPQGDCAVLTGKPGNS